MMPSTMVQKRVICTCITDFAMTPAIKPTTMYQMRCSIPSIRNCNLACVHSNDCRVPYAKPAVGRAGSPLHAESAAPTEWPPYLQLKRPRFPDCVSAAEAVFTFYLGNPFSSVPEFLIEPSALASEQTPYKNCSRVSHTRDLVTPYRGKGLYRLRR
jgi:hypothetical protein